MNACFFAKHLPALYSQSSLVGWNCHHPHFADEGPEAQGDCDLLRVTQPHLCLWGLSLSPSPQTLTHELNI